LIHFANLYENQAAKWLAVAFSCLSMLVTTPMILSVVAYESNNQVHTYFRNQKPVFTTRIRPQG
jgi:predicted cobalt transporter CbtA